MTPLAAALIAYQRKHNLTQQTVAIRLGVSRHWLNDLIAGRRKPFFRLAVRCYKLGIPADDILRGHDEEMAASG